MMFKDREHAAVLLLDKLQKYKGQNVVVAGIPRGAMPMAKIIADGLQGQLGAVLVHKIPSPESEEFAIASVGISGHIHRSSYVHQHGIPEHYIQTAALEQLETLQERARRYGLGKQQFQNKVVIIVDDGIATGETTLAAIHEVRSQNPQKIVLAAGVSSSEAAEQIERLVDEFIVLSVRSDLYSISQFYESFPQVTDDVVIWLLHGEGSEEERAAW